MATLQRETGGVVIKFHRLPFFDAVTTFASGSLHIFFNGIAMRIFMTGDTFCRIIDELYYFGSIIVKAGFMACLARNREMTALQTEISLLVILNRKLRRRESGDLVAFRAFSF